VRGRRRAGAVLPLTLVYTLLLSALAATALQGAALQLRMARNAQSQLVALRQAGAVVREMALRRDNFPLEAPVGHRECLPGDAAADCDGHGLAPPLHTGAGPGVELRARVSREYPQTLTLPPGAQSGTAHALFEVEATMQGDAAGAGSARVVLGVAVPVGAGAPVPLYWREPGIDPL